MAYPVVPPAMRTHAGWTFFRFGAAFLHLSARTLHTDCALAHVARGVAQRLDRAPRRSAEPI